MSQVKEERQPLNGVNTPALFATINAVKGTPELGKFQFRAKSEWVSGTHSKIEIDSYSGAGGEHEHKTTFKLDGDHPEVLVGEDRGVVPVEYLLAGLASCLMAGIGNIAAARGVKLESVEATLEGDINLLGVLGLSDEVRNGYENIRVSFNIKGDAPAEKLREIVEQSKNRSAVYDVLTKGVPVEINVAA